MESPSQYLYSVKAILGETKKAKTKKADPIMKKALRLDLPGTTVSDRVALGRRLARKRLLSSQQQLVYRNSTGVAYEGVVFLNSETILALDKNMYMDIVRLPRKRDSDCHPQSLGTVVESQLTIAQRNGPESDGNVHLQSFDNGNGVAIGYPDGELRVLGTEHTSFSSTSTMSAESTRNYNGYFSKMVQSRRPLRRYRISGEYSLYDQLKKPHLATNLEEIVDWDSFGTNHIVFKPKWDIRHSTFLQAVYCLSEIEGCFCLRDERDSCFQNKVCVSKQRDRSRSSYGYRYFINSVCFVNDFTIATSDMKNIKLWDIRGTSGTPIGVHPSFPRESTYCIDTFRELNSIKSGGREDCRVQLQCSGNGNLLALTVLYDDDPRNLPSFLIDPARDQIVHRYDDLVLWEDLSNAVDKRNGLVASDWVSEIRVFDRIPVETQIVTSQRDRDGLVTKLADLCFDDTGSSLVGATVDGDIYCWR